MVRPEEPQRELSTKERAVQPHLDKHWSPEYLFLICQPQHDSLQDVSFVDLRSFAVVGL